jgi:hypothetical protein
VVDVTRLLWGAYGERFYEVGVDRGVLYVLSQPGVAWNGLVSVAELSSGGEAKAYYCDGIKYLNISAAEEFEANLNAISHPSQFDVCDGRLGIHNGLYATQQRRQSFGFSYRTLIGNDTNGPDHGYKIHLVYNALAGRAQRPNVSLGASSSPAIFSWNITTKPPVLTGYKPTSHFVIDSRTTDPEVLAEVEDLLYGTESDDPTLPTPTELIALFAP